MNNNFRIIVEHPLGINSATVAISFSKGPLRTAPLMTSFASTPNIRCRMAVGARRTRPRAVCRAGHAGSGTPPLRETPSINKLVLTPNRSGQGCPRSRCEAAQDASRYEILRRCAAQNDNEAARLRMTCKNGNPRGVTSWVS